MTKASSIKRGLTLGWSITLGIILLGCTGLLLMPATKSARIRFEQPDENSTDSNPTDEEDDELDPDDSIAPQESSP